MKEFLTGTLFIIVVLAATSFAQAAQVDFSISGPPTTGIPNLIGHWALDGNALDSSGNGNHGTVVGNTVLTSGKIGQAYSFDGNGDYISINSFNGDTSSEGTISFWAYVTSITEYDGFFVQNDASLYITEHGGDMKFVLKDSVGNVAINLRTTSAIPLNQWAHFAFTWDASGGDAYFNGNPENSASAGAISYKSLSGTIQIGQDRNMSDRSIDGLMDDIRVYNRALGNEEIQMLYTMTDAPPVDEPPVDEPPVADCSVAGTCYYVDNAVSSSGNGSSWNNAWRRFADIDWSQINPGNVIYISGGTSKKTYNEKLVVGASGTPGSQITITNGVDTGHNGQAVIDGTGFGSSKGITMSHTSAGGACDGYITVSDLHFRNWGYCAIGGYGKNIDGYTVYNEADAIKGIIVENNNVVIAGRVGVILTHSNNCIVRNNYIDTPDWVDSQTDGIYSQINRSNTYENNTIIINNHEPTGHDDCIQMFTDTDITIKGNYLEQNNNKISNAQGIMASALFGKISIQRNVIHLKSSSSALNFIEIGDATIEFIGNTVSSKNSTYLFMLQDFDNPIVRNNIGVITGTNGAPLTIVTRYQSSLVYDPSKISHNLLWNPNTADIANLYGLGRLKQAELEARGINIGGLTVDPQFKNPENRDFTPMNPRVCTASDTGSYAGALPCN